MMNEAKTPGAFVLSFLVWSRLTGLPVALSNDRAAKTLDYSTAKRFGAAPQ
jgi:hypothetical protein